MRNLALNLNLHMPSIIRYIGGDHIGDHLPRQQILKELKPSVDKELYNDVYRVLYHGSPNKVHGYSSKLNFWNYKRYVNHTTVTKMPNEH